MRDRQEIAVGTLVHAENPDSFFGLILVVAVVVPKLFFGLAADMTLQRIVWRAFVPGMATPSLLAGFEAAAKGVEEVHLAILADGRETPVVADRDLVLGIDELQLAQFELLCLERCGSDQLDDRVRNEHANLPVTSSLFCWYLAVHS